ncbi:MAG: type II toxin-antitoxin system RelE/ParE family toxin [Gallionella sp.]
MSIFKTKVFAHWQAKEGVTDQSLCAAVDEMSRGLIDAVLGSGLVKKRVPRLGEGKRSGFRTLLATNTHDRWFFVYGFAKNARDNIDQREMQALKRLASVLLGMDEKATAKLLNNQELKEICQ